MVSTAEEHAGFSWIEAPVLPQEEGSLIDRFAREAIIRIARMEWPPEFLFTGIGFLKDVLVARSIIDHWPEGNGPVPMILAVGASLEFISGQKKETCS